LRVDEQRWRSGRSTPPFRSDWIRQQLSSSPLPYCFAASLAALSFGELPLFQSWRYQVASDRTRRFNIDACAFISFYFRAANQLTSEQRMRTIAAANNRLREEPVGALEKEWIVRQEFLTIDLASFLRSAHQQLVRLSAARALVVEDDQRPAIGPAEGEA
jgi:hypothetical protein